MILKNVSYNLNGHNPEFKYHFENGVSIVREYILPTMRIHDDIGVVTIPIINLRFFVHEIIGIFFVVIILVISFCRLRNFLVTNSLNFGNAIAPLALILMFIWFSVYLNTHFIAQIGTFFFGKNVSGIVISSNNTIENDSNELEFHVKLKNSGEDVILKGPSSKYKIGDLIILRIHPDNIPYYAMNQSISYFFMLFFYPTAYVILLFMILFDNVKI